MNIRQDADLFRGNINNFIGDLQALCDDALIMSTILNLTNDIIQSIRCGGKVILCGNGGFAAVSQHIAAEMMGKLHIKRNPISAISLVSDISTITCIANDYGYEKIFARQLAGIGKVNDIFIVLSGSGQSKNILEAVSEANIIGIKTYALVGMNSNDILKELGANVITLSSFKTDIIQDMAMHIFHAICHIVEQKFGDDCQSKVWEYAIEIAAKSQANTLLLDRDGVINHLIPNDYVMSIEDIRLNDIFLSYCQRLSECFDYIFIVSNQACIGKGIMLQEKLDEINNYIIEQITSRGGRVTGIYTCPDRESDSPNRKPNIGLAKQINHDYPMVDYSKSLMIGDSFSDMLFAKRIGALYIKIHNV